MGIKRQKIVTARSRHSVKNAFEFVVLLVRVRVIKAAGGAKAPLVHTEALVFLRSCVEDFGASALPARQVVGFAVSELEHVNPKV